MLLKIAYNIIGHGTVVWVSYTYKLSPVASIYLLVEQVTQYLIAMHSNVCNSLASIYDEELLVRT